MDAIAAIGLVSGILTFVSFSTKLVEGAIEIQEALDGTLDANRTRQGVTEEMRRLSACLLPPDDSGLSGDEKALCMLARECGLLSNQLIKLLEDIKPGDNPSKRQSLWSSLKNKIKEKERMDLEQRLDYCRSQLGILLHFMASHQTDASLRAIIDLVKGNAGKFDSLRRSIQCLEHGISVHEFSTEAQEQIKSLLTLPEQVSKTISQQRILRTLAFDGMRNRRDLVHDPHDTTFKWFMHASKSVEEASKVQACERFTSWLESGQGIFHISGKLGSGKSTLMKYLGSHVQGSGHLERWAGNRKLVFTQFFFWRPGTQLQKSLAGLYRTLLHDIFQTCPELIPTVMPSYWAQAESMPWRSDHKLDIDGAQIKAAFNRLIKKDTMDSYQDHCFCFFIDGLDEFEATTQTDHTDLASLLQSWAEAGMASNNIKLCVSSREHNSFMNTFSAERRLRLHELTRTDMIACVRDKLDRISASSGFDELIHEIVGKSQGIFQWLAIVVNNMRSEIDNGITDAEEFRSLLKKLPSEINALYKHIFESLRNTTRAYRTLAMVTKATELDLAWFSVDAYSFFHEYERDKEYILRESFQDTAAHIHIGGLSRAELGKTRLRGWCGGLLDTDIVADDSGFPESLDIPDIVRLTHRSVADFLKAEDVQSKMISSLNAFDVLDALSQMFVADICMFRDKCHAYHHLHRLYRERHNASLDSKSPYKVEEAFDRVWAHHDSLKHVFDRILLLEGGPDGYGQVADYPRCDPNDLYFHDLRRPIYWTLNSQSYEYPVWKIQNDPSVTNTSDKVALLAYLTMRYNGPSAKVFHDREVSSKVLESLLGKGLLYGRTRMRVPYKSVPITELELRDGKAIELTILQQLLMGLWMRQWSYPSGIPYRVDLNGFTKHLIWFLKNGSDATFSVRMKRLERCRAEASELVPQARESLFDYGEVLFCFRQRKSTGELEDVVSRETIQMPLHLEPTDRTLGSYEYSSLREWVEHWEIAPETKSELFRLLDRRSLIDAGIAKTILLGPGGIRVRALGVWQIILDKAEGSRWVVGVGSYQLGLHFLVSLLGALLLYLTWERYSFFGN